MNWKEACKLSIVLALASFFTTFLIPYNVAGIEEALLQFIFEAIRFFLGVFFTNFVAIAGLAKYTETKKKDNDIPEE